MSGGSAALLDKQEFSRSKQFPSPAKSQPAAVGKRTEDSVEESKEEQQSQRGGLHSSLVAAVSSSSSGSECDDGGSMSTPPAPSVEELMDDEFSRIIGHDSIKQQLRQFYKKVQLDRIRAAHGKERDNKRLYHMIFSGPPGTGNTRRALIDRTDELKARWRTAG